MIAILSLITVLTLSMVVTRVASAALTYTGMTPDSARFQARSAFTGVGFTTSEAETILRHPVRRRIVSWLMLAGNVGIVTAMSSLLLSTVGMAGETELLERLGVLAAGLLFVWWLARSRLVDRMIFALVGWALRRFTRLEIHDFSHLLHLREDYGVAEMEIGEGHWLAGKTLGEARLSGEGVLVLGVHCPGQNYIGAPTAETALRDGDVLTVYGRRARVAELDARGAAAGSSSHAEATREQAEISRDEHARAGRDGAARA